MKISKNNFLVIAFVISLYIFANYIVFYNNYYSFFAISLLQFFCIAISVSEIGEYILRKVYRCVDLNEAEKNKVLGLFAEVCDSAKMSDIKLFVDNDMNINAFACGRKTVAITKGAMSYLSDEEIQGIFAHELGHIKHGDTILPLVLLVGNFLMIFLFLAIKLLSMFLKMCSIFSSNRNEMKWMSNLISTINTIIYTTVCAIIEFFILINQRKNEYQADQYAFEIGYGKGLLDSLYMLSQMDNGKMSIIERLKSSHPHIRDRIISLEKILKNE